VEKGLLVAVIGSVGTGKSSLIQAMLGEMYKTGGSINLHGKIAFHSQQPWVMNRTLRDNITLGKKLDEKRLNEVLAAVALDVDIRTLPAGLDTEIGEKVRSSSLSLSCYYHHYHHYHHYYHHYHHH
jgi:ABC-type multidrug transport system fused ATPase/permease subunit